MLEFTLFLLLAAANGAPVIAARLLGKTAQQPVDGGRCLRDGYRLFGDSKTWRGLVAALLASVTLALLLGLPGWLGWVVGLSSMAGDLFSSFCKRRLGLQSSAKFTGLDQIPEALLPCVLVYWFGDYGWTVVVVPTLLFVLGDMVFSPLLYRLGVRRVPH